MCSRYSLFVFYCPSIAILCYKTALMVLKTIYIVRHGVRATHTHVSSSSSNHGGQFRASIPPPDRHAGYAGIKPIVPSPTGRPADPPLTAHGERQAAELATYVAELDTTPIRWIRTSPYYRCVQTIAPCATQLNLPVTCDIGLRYVDIDLSH